MVLGELEEPVRVASAVDVPRPMGMGRERPLWGRVVMTSQGLCLETSAGTSRNEGPENLSKPPERSSDYQDSLAQRVSDFGHWKT